jgi:hypothetical protein
MSNTFIALQAHEDAWPILETALIEENPSWT